MRSNVIDFDPNRRMLADFVVIVEKALNTMTHTRVEELSAAQAEERKLAMQAMETTLAELRAIDPENVTLREVVDAMGRAVDRVGGRFDLE